MSMVGFKETERLLADVTEKSVVRIVDISFDTEMWKGMALEFQKNYARARKESDSLIRQLNVLERDLEKDKKEIEKLKADLHENMVDTAKMKKLEKELEEAAKFRSTHLWCSRCGTWKEDVCFYTNRTKPQRRFREYWCKQCCMESDKRRHHMKKAAKKKGAA